MRHHIPKIALGAFVVVLTGCSSTPEHTNTLMFGTTTKFALDVSVSPVNGSPDLTVGYKRNEGVWMPLLANTGSGTNRAPGACTDCKFTGDETNGNKKDTYSVLASFGATFGGGAEAGAISSGEKPSSNVTAKGGLAQFFATGIAAQNLATSGGARLVSVQSADAETAARAIEYANSSKIKADEVTKKLKDILGEKTYAEAIEKGITATSLLKAKNGVIVASIVDSSGNLNQTKWTNLVDSSTLDDPQKTQLKGLNNLGQVVAFLSGQAGAGKLDVIDALHSKL